MRDFPRSRPEPPSSSPAATDAVRRGRWRAIGRWPLLSATAVAAVLAPTEVAIDEDQAGWEQAPLEILTLDEAAAFLRIDPVVLAGNAEHGAVPGRRISGRWRFSRTALLGWLEAPRPAVPSTTETAEPETAAAIVPGQVDTSGIPWRWPAPESGLAGWAGRDAAVAAQARAAREAPSGGDGARDAESLPLATPTVADSPVAASPGAAEAVRPRAVESGSSGDGGRIEAPPGGLPLSDRRMAAIAGRGPGGASDAAAEAPTSEGEAGEPETIGEQPTAPTAEQIALRGEQVVLRKGEATLELDLFYTDGASALPPIGASAFGSAFDSDSFTVAYSGRYGIQDDLQLFVGNSVSHVRRDFAASATDFERTQRTRWNDIRGSLRYAALKEATWQPNLIVSLEGRIPGEDSAWGLGGRVTASKSLDPVVVFADFGYLHRFDSGSVDRPLARDLIDVSVGYAFAINDRFSVKAQVGGVFSLGTTENERFPALETEVYTLQLGATTLLTRRLFIEPTVTFTLSGPPSVTFGVSLPYTFMAN